MFRRHGIRSTAMAAAAAAALILSSCAWASPTRTNEAYAPSDGVRVSLVDGDEVRVENVMLLTEAEGSPAQLFGAVVNDTPEAVTVGVSVGGSQSTIEVDANGVARLEEETDVIESSPAAPGSTSPVTFEFRGAQTRDVPVLDGTLSPYDEYLP